MDRKWDNWVSGFTIYLAVVMQSQLLKGPALVEYFDIVHHAYNSFVGSAWLRYDEVFRMWATMDPSLPWDGKDTEVWTELVAQDWPAGGTHLDGGHMLAVGQGRMPFGKRSMARRSQKMCAGNIMP